MIHVTTTCDSLDTARHLARRALEDRLAACANVTPGIVSLFRWQGAMEEEEEVSVTFKTTEARREALVALIAREHPYDLPVITWEAVATTAEAGEWCQAETAPASDD
jgi:periplasmic divalent cation tolerance protein